MSLGLAVAVPEEGWAAFDRKDYTTALKVWKQLAQRGDADG